MFIKTKYNSSTQYSHTADTS